MEDPLALMNETLVGPAIAWLRANGANPEMIATVAEQQLYRRRRNLPPDRRMRYLEVVLLGEFFVRWASKHRQQPLNAIIEDEEASETELRPFQLAIIAAADERVFDRIASQFVRQKIVQSVGLSIGTAEEFSSYVADNTIRFAKIFLTNFDVNAQKAALKSVRYLQKTAVSWYLTKRTRPICADAPNLQAYLARSKLSPRTILAVKLAYLPSMLSPAERTELRETYGFSGSLALRRSIDEIARLLGYPSGTTLSRKLYRVRRWCQKSKVATQEEL